MESSILCGSCYDILPSIPAESTDLIVFSPPYDGIRDYEDKPKVDLVELGRLLYRVSKVGAICAVVLQDQTKNFAKSLTTFRTAVQWVDNTGWRLFECCIYSRPGNPGAWWSQRFRVDHEYILLFLKGDRPRYFNKDGLSIPSKGAGRVYSGTDRRTDGTFNKIRPGKVVNDTKCRGTIWSYATSNSERNRLKANHPATFPDLLAEDLIKCFSEPGELILDPMCGAGTTLVMAKKNSRRYIGIDVSQKYVDIADQRLVYDQGASVVTRLQYGKRWTRLLRSWRATAPPT